MIGPRFDAAAHARRMRAEGFWVDKTYDEFLQKAIAATPDKLAILADRADRAEQRRFTYAEFGDLVSRAAAALESMGIGRGDVVSVQMPNWWEFAVVALAAARVGAVVNPLMPIFRERELTYMLDFAETKLLVVPKVFRGFDHEAMAASLRPSLPKLQHVIVVDGEGPNSFNATLLSGAERLPPPPIGEIGALPDRRNGGADVHLGHDRLAQGRHALPEHADGLQHRARRALRSRRERRDAGLLAAGPYDRLRRGYAAGPEDRRHRDIPGRLGAEARRRHHGGRGRHLFRGRRAVPLRHVRGGRRRRAETREAAQVPLRGRADSAGADRARLPRTRPSGLLALGHDRSRCRAP